MRIGINVPNDLLKRVKTLQPDVNISQVCREAIEQLAERHERTIKQVEIDNAEIEKHIYRLAAIDDPTLIELDWEKYALDDARQWIGKVGPGHSQHILDRYDAYIETIGGDNFVALYGHFNERFMGDPWIQRQWSVARNSNVLKESRQAYQDVWLGYVIEVRRKCLALIQAKQEQVMAERLRAIQSRPEPEVPPHLL